MIRNQKGLLVVNTFGALGYISNLVQWMWALLIVAYPLLTTGSMWSLPVPPVTTAAQPATFVPTGPLAIVLASLITLIVIVLAIYAIILMPHTVGKAGARVTRTLANATIPTVTHHKKITKKQRQRLSHRIIIALKAASALIPVVLVALLPSVAPIDHTAALGAAVFFLAITAIYFGFQYALGTILKLDKSAIW